MAVTPIHVSVEPLTDAQRSSIPVQVSDATAGGVVSCLLKAISTRFFALPPYQITLTYELPSPRRSEDDDLPNLQSRSDQQRPAEQH